MSESWEIVILCGGRSEERDVSIRSAEAVARALEGQVPVRLVVLEENALPEGLEPSRDIIFPVMHGQYGEDGVLQAELEASGFVYAGSDAQSSALCMTKERCKKRVAAASVPVLEGVEFLEAEEVDCAAIISRMGHSLVIKPEDSGSSVGLHLVEGERALAECIQNLDKRRWMIEPRFHGRELTVGVLHAEAMGVVEIICSGGVYDYAHKYQPGHTEYHFPADIPETLAARLCEAAESAFEACGCRDFARADFLLNASEAFIFLEINTIPGLTDTSLLPKSARCSGLDFSQLVYQMVSPAIERFNTRSPAQFDA